MSNRSSTRFSSYLIFIYLGVGHPAARFDLVGVQAPVLELLLEEGPADVGGVVELPGPVVVEYLSKDPGVPVEEVLVQDRVVVAQGLRQPGQAGGRDLLQGGLVGFVPHPAAVQDAAVLRVHLAGRLIITFEPAAEQQQPQGLNIWIKLNFLKFSKNFTIKFI